MIRFIDTAGQITAIADSKTNLSQLRKCTVPYEQAGFIVNSTPLPRFAMVGGELSINGTLAAGFALNCNQLITSGLNDPISIFINPNRVSAEFPCNLVRSIKDNQVILQGISYQVIPDLPQDKRVYPNYMAKLKNLLSTNPASGLIFYKQNRITILTYFKVTEEYEYVWESACGSGSLAYYLLSGTSQIIQPSGQTISIVKNSATLSISTTVKLLS